MPLICPELRASASHRDDPVPHGHSILVATATQVVKPHVAPAPSKLIQMSARLVPVRHWSHLVWAMRSRSLFNLCQD